MISLPITLLAVAIVALTVLTVGWLIYRRTRDMFVVWLSSPFSAILGMAIAQQAVAVMVLR